MDRISMGLCTIAMILCLVKLGAIAAAESAELEVQVGGGYGRSTSESFDGMNNYKYGELGLLYDDRYWITGGYERSDDDFYGQPMAAINAATIAAGVKLPLVDKLHLNVGMGYWIPKLTIRPEIQDEMTYTHLVNRHENIGRPIPLHPVYPDPQGFQQMYMGCGNSDHVNCFDSTYQIDSSPFALIGLEYEFTSWLSAGIRYRWLRPSNYMAIGINDGRIYMDWDEAPGGWWMENGSRNFDTITFDFKLKY